MTSCFIFWRTLFEKLFLLPEVTRKSVEANFVLQMNLIMQFTNGCQTAVQCQYVADIYISMQAFIIT